jgi:hypothetical protein
LFEDFLKEQVSTKSAFKVEVNQMGRRARRLFVEPRTAETGQMKARRILWTKAQENTSRVDPRQFETIGTSKFSIGQRLRRRASAECHTVATGNTTSEGMDFISAPKGDASKAEKITVTRTGEMYCAREKSPSLQSAQSRRRKSS